MQNIRVHALKSSNVVIVESLASVVFTRGRNPRRGGHGFLFELIGHTCRT